MICVSGFKDSAILAGADQSDQCGEPGRRPAVRQRSARQADASVVCPRLQTQPLRLHQQSLGVRLFERLLRLFRSPSQSVA